MFKRTLILYHAEGREYIIDEMMRDCIMDAGIAETVFIAKDYDAIYSIYNYMPDLIISTIPRDEYGSSLFTFVKMACNCVWVAIPNEGFFMLDPETISMQIGKNLQPRNLVDYYFFWGPGVAKAAGEYLEKTNKLISSDRIKVFGYLPYEKKMITKYQKRDGIVEVVRAESTKYDKVVMFVTGIMAKQVPIEILYTELDTKRNNKIEVERAKQRLLVTEKYNDSYIDMIYKSAKSNPNILFIIKKHPVEKDYYSENDVTRYSKLIGIKNIITIDEPIQISSFFEDIDLFIHYGSTSVMEAYIYGIPSVCLTNESDTEEIGDYGNGLSYANYKIDVDNIDGLCDLLRSELEFSRDDAIEKCLKTYMNYEQGEYYEPSRLFKEALKDIVNVPSKLSYKNDPLVKNRLRYASCIKLKTLLTAKMIKAKLAGDKNTYAKIKGMYNCYKQAKRI